MAPVRYSKTIREPDRVISKIGECRETMIEASKGVRPFGPAYHAIHMVTTAIDALATFTSNERHYFGHRFASYPPSADAKPGLDLEESPHETPEELAPSRPKG